jgi:site-specific DNA recombinase
MTTTSRHPLPVLAALPGTDRKSKGSLTPLVSPRSDHKGTVGVSLMRCAIYARYSSEGQRAESIKDQVEICRRYVERQGWILTQVYDDAAISGASKNLRPGFQRMLHDAESRRFDVIVCEAIDRLGRKLADVADLFDRLTFHGVQIHATSIGLVTQMRIGIMGTMAQMTLSDLRDKTRRGQLGRARAGRIPGGLAYGYEVVPPAPSAKEAGERRIKPDEADIVRRIFRDYAAGSSPRHIARVLNAEGIPGPNGRPWGDTTIRGQVDRGTGLLNNTLYIGRLSWDRCSYVKDPRTGKRVARPHGQEAWETTEVPPLRIIEQPVWDAVKARQAVVRFAIGRDETGNALNRAHRREFLLSGLIACGCCCGSFTIMAKNRYGCATRRSKGTCDNTRTILRQRVEQRVLSGLKERMLAPDLVAEFVRVFAEETVAAHRQDAARRSLLDGQLADVERRLQAVLRAIEDEAWSEALRKRLSELETRKEALQRQREGFGNPAPVIRLRPNAADIYRAKVADLEASLNAPEIRAEASDALRALIDRVVLTPDADAPDGLRAELYDDLAEILRLDERARTQLPSRPDNLSLYKEKPPGTRVLGGQLSVVAGARNHLCRTRFRAATERTARAAQAD